MSTEKSVEQRVEALEKHLSSVATAVTLGFKALDNNFQTIAGSIKELNDKVDAMDTRLCNVEKKVESLAKSAHVSFNSVDVKLDGIHEEIKKIDTVSRYTEEFENMLRVEKP